MDQAVQAVVPITIPDNALEGAFCVGVRGVYQGCDAVLNVKSKIYVLQSLCLIIHIISGHKVFQAKALSFFFSGKKEPKSRASSAGVACFFFSMLWSLFIYKIFMLS